MAYQVLLLARSPALGSDRRLNWCQVFGTLFYPRQVFGAVAGDNGKEFGSFLKTLGETFPFINTLTFHFFYIVYSLL